eukprot:950043-Pleurochrysis_carterae.AAC.1
MCHLFSLYATHQMNRRGSVSLATSPPAQEYTTHWMPSVSQTSTSNSQASPAIRTVRLPWTSTQST